MESKKILMLRGQGWWRRRNTKENNSNRGQL
jgi:hypothetical protein